MKTNIIYILFFVIIFHLYNCTNNSLKKQLNFKVTENITCEDMSYSEIIGIPSQLLLKDSFLVINDFREDSLLHLYNINKQMFAKRLVACGDGPNELIKPIDIQLKENKILLFSRPTFTLYSIEDSFMVYNDLHINKEFMIPTESSKIFALNDSLYISSGVFSKRYALINKKGDKIDEFGSYPAFWSDENNIPVGARAMFHQCSFSQRPKHNNFISYSSHVLELYEYNAGSNALPYLINQILFSPYSYTYSTGNTLFAKPESNVEIGIQDAFCTEQYIYILYNTSTEEENTHISHIYILDWSGEPVKSLKFDHIISKFVINEKTK